MAEDRIQIRETRVEEKEAILSVAPDVYFGLDYLPDKFDRMAADPNITGFGAYLDGQMVAYNAGHILDGGTTLIMRAARVKDGYQGLGLYGRLSKESVSTLRQRHPGLVREAITTNNLNMATNKTGLLRRYQLLESRALYWWTCKDDQLPVVSEADVTSTSTMEQRDLFQLFQRPETATLFPQRRITINWVPFRIDEKSNFDQHFFDSTLILHNHVQSSVRSGGRDASTESPLTTEDPSQTLDGSGKQGSGHEEVKMITFGSLFRRDRQGALSYYIDAYGTDLDLLKQHILLHQKRAFWLAGRLGLSSVLLTCCCEESLPPKELADFAHSLGLKTYDVAYTTMILLEQQYEEKQV